MGSALNWRRLSSRIRTYCSGRIGLWREKNVGRRLVRQPARFCCSWRTSYDRARTMKRRSGSSRQEGRRDRSERNIVPSNRKLNGPLSPEALRQIDVLRTMPEESIDFSDIPLVPGGPWHRYSDRQAWVARVIEPQFLVRRKLVLVRGDARKIVDVEIGPVRTHATDVSCHVRIVGPDQERNYDIYGVDGVQAVQLALRFAGSELDRLGGDHWEFSSEHGHGFDRFTDVQTTL